MSTPRLTRKAILKATIPCDKCKKQMHEDEIGCFENQWCQTCLDADEAKWEAYWRPIYEGEKRAGLLPANHYRD